MYSNNQTTQPHLYLLCSHSISASLINKVKEDVQSVMATTQKDDLFDQFMKWHKKDNELAVLSMYAIEDIPLPKKFELIFQRENAENYVEVDFTITQAIINTWCPIATISHGHKHVLILEFENTVPGIFNLLGDFDETKPYQDVNTLVFCAKADFELLKETLKFERSN